MSIVNENRPAFEKRLFSYSSTELTRFVEDLTQFLDAFKTYHSAYTDESLGVPNYEQAKLRSSLSIAAGKADIPLKAFRWTIGVRMPYGTGTYTGTPTTLWTTLFQEIPIFDYDTIVSSTEAAIGFFQDGAERARTHEKQLATRIANVLSFPIRVWSQLMAASNTRGQKVASGIFAATVVGIVSTVGGSLCWFLIQKAFGW